MHKEQEVPKLRKKFRGENLTPNRKTKLPHKNVSLRSPPVIVLRSFAAGGDLQPVLQVVDGNTHSAAADTQTQHHPALQQKHRMPMARILGLFVGELLVGERRVGDARSAGRGMGNTTADPLASTVMTGLNALGLGGPPAWRERDSSAPGSSLEGGVAVCSEGGS